VRWFASSAKLDESRPAPRRSRRQDAHERRAGEKENRERGHECLP